MKKEQQRGYMSEDDASSYMPSEGEEDEMRRE